VEKYPQANWAIITGSGNSLLAMDVDPLNGGREWHYVLKYSGDTCKSVGLTNIPGLTLSPRMWELPPDLLAGQFGGGHDHR
jgi:hypothetical protein